MTPQNPTRPALADRSTLIAFLVYVIVGGGSAVAMRTTYGELAPFWAASSRFLVAAVVVWALVWFRHIPLPRGRALLGAVLFGTLTGGLAFALITWGLVDVPASHYQILMATVPLVTMVLASTLAGENITWKFLAGAALVLAGVFVGVLLPSRKRHTVETGCTDSYGQVLPGCV